jgi:hypothetical protein
MDFTNGDQAASISDEWLEAQGWQRRQPVPSATLQAQVNVAGGTLLLTVWSTPYSTNVKLSCGRIIQLPWSEHGVIPSASEAWAVISQHNPFGRGW